jgi:hypothetical protein
MPGDSGELADTRVHSTHYFRTRGNGCTGHPAFPTPSVLRAKISGKPRAPRAARMRKCVHVIARSSCDETIHASFCFLSSCAMDCFASLAMTVSIVLALRCLTIESDRTPLPKPGDVHLSPCGRGRIASSDAIRVRGCGLSIDLNPSPQPSPTRGEGAHRFCWNTDASHRIRGGHR